MTDTYREQVLRYRVMKQLNDPKRNPDGNWSLVFSTMDLDVAQKVLLEQVQTWGKLGDAFKIEDGGQVTYVERSMWLQQMNKFNQVHNESLANIVSLLEDKDASMKHIANWLFETKHNPYGFLPESWAGGMKTATGFESLLNCIHHALIDDGEISFPVVNGEPRIRFVGKWEDNAEYLVLTRQERRWYDGEERYFGSFKDRLKVTWLNTVFEFTKAKDEYELNQLKHYFLMDAARQGVEYALKHYGDREQFNKEWINEVADYKKKVCGSGMVNHGI